MRALMSEGLPAPSMIVVFSFSTTIFFASPRSLMLAFSSDRPTSSEMTVPPVRVAMSCSMALRRAPKPRAVAPAALGHPRMLLATTVARASPPPASATTTTGRPALGTASRRGDGLAERLSEARRDRAELSNRVGVLAGLGELLELLDGGDHRLVDAALEVHRVAARGDGLQALAHDRLGEHGGGRGAIAGLVGGVGRDFLHHLRAHVLEFVLELDFLRDRHAVLGDGGGAEALIEHGIAALRAQSRLDGVGEDVKSFGAPTVTKDGVSVAK